MLSYRLGTVNDFLWGFKPVLSYSKPHTFSACFGEEKERKIAFNLSNLNHTENGLFQKCEKNQLHFNLHRKLN